MDAETLEELKRGRFGNIFLIGSNIDGNETVVKEMYENGHIVGNHTFHHVEMTKLSDEKAMEEIRMTNEKNFCNYRGAGVVYAPAVWGMGRRSGKEMQVLPVTGLWIRLIGRRKMRMKL